MAARACARWSARPAASAAEEILTFWFVATKPYQWFRRDAAFDAAVRRRFGGALDEARAGALDAWRAHPAAALARILILDQFSRNIYRGDARSFAQDGQALDAARNALIRRFDMIAPARMQAFFYMPFMHGEDLSVQDESVALFTARMAASDNVRHAVIHRNIIKRFGRFPHRNRLLGRTSTPAEIAFLKAGGFNP